MNYSIIMIMIMIIIIVVVVVLLLLLLILFMVSRSSQCSTTGVTKDVVCAILSVGWCI